MHHNFRGFEKAVTKHMVTAHLRLLSQPHSLRTGRFLIDSQPASAHLCRTFGLQKIEISLAGQCDGVRTDAGDMVVLRSHVVGELLLHMKVHTADGCDEFKVLLRQYLPSSQDTAVLLPSTAQISVSIADVVGSVAWAPCGGGHGRHIVQHTTLQWVRQKWQT